MHERPQRTDPLMLFSLLYRNPSRKPQLYPFYQYRKILWIAGKHKRTLLTSHRCLWQFILTTLRCFTTLSQMFLKEKFPKKNSDNNSYTITMCLGFPGGSVVKNPPINAGDTGSIPGLKRAPRVGSGNPLQYSYLENSMDRAAWRVTVHGVAKSDTISD